MQFSAADVETICRALLGAPNRALSTKTNWRYGKHGSLSIDIKKATWFDWETSRGGGILDLITRETGKTGKDAMHGLHQMVFPGCAKQILKIPVIQASRG